MTPQSTIYMRFSMYKVAGWIFLRKFGMLGLLNDKKCLQKNKEKNKNDKYHC